MDSVASTHRVVYFLGPVINFAVVPAHEVVFLSLHAGDLDCNTAFLLSLRARPSWSLTAMIAHMWEDYWHKCSVRGLLFATCQADDESIYSFLAEM